MEKRLAEAAGYVGGAICVVGGLYLFLIRAMGENSLLEMLAHGIGIYCIGKGLFVISNTFLVGAGKP